jgi:osmoprotectant transport system substrate-binding protein
VRASKYLPLSLAALAVVAACGSDSAATSTTSAVKAKLVISSTTDPKSVLFTEIYGQSLEKSAFRVARKKEYPTEDALYAALEAGDVQMIVVTTQDLYKWAEKKAGKTDPLPASTAEQTAAITKILPATLKIDAASSAEDKDVIFCSTTFTDANSVTTLTDLGTKPQVATIAAPEGFDTATPLGAAALKDTYQIQFKSVVTTASDKILDAVTGGSADCGVGRSGDPALAPTTLKVLEDDKAIVPNDVVIPVLTAGAATADVVSVLDTTSAKLTSAQYRSLMQRLKDGASPELAANEFASSQ